MSDLSSQIQQSTALQIVDIAKMPPEAVTKAQEIAKSINLEDSQAVIQYGVGAQTKISGFADSILTEIRNKDSGYVGETLAVLMGHIKNVDASGLQKDPGFFGKLFGGIKAEINKFMTRYEKLSTQIDRTVQELEKQRMQLIKDITLLDTMYQKNSEYLKELDIYIAAGQMKLEQAKAELLPELVKKAEASNDPADAQRVQDFNQFLNRFEKKLHDMKLSRMISIQTGPQIRLIQNNDQTLVEKIQSSVINTIPLWKNQIIIAISLFRQKGALELQREVTNTTNDLLSKNSEMLKQGSIEVAKEGERGIVEIETLAKVNNDLIATIEETLKIQAEGKQKRAAAEQELVKMEDDLKARLKSIQ
jgi:uncharacterized protein YaaN involved in tellurite resistance